MSTHIAPELVETLLIYSSHLCSLRFVLEKAAMLLVETAPERASATTGQPKALLIAKAATTSSAVASSATISKPLWAEPRVVITSDMPGDPDSMLGDPLGMLPELVWTTGLVKGALDWLH